MAAARAFDREVTLTRHSITPLATIFYGDQSYKQPPLVWSLDSNQDSLFAIGVAKRIQVSKL